MEPSVVWNKYTCVQYLIFVQKITLSITYLFINDHWKYFESFVLDFL